MQTDANGPHNTAILCWRIARLRNGRGLTTGPLRRVHWVLPLKPQPQRDRPPEHTDSAPTAHRRPSRRAGLPHARLHLYSPGLTGRGGGNVQGLWGTARLPPRAYFAALWREPCSQARVCCAGRHGAAKGTADGRCIRIHALPHGAREGARCEAAGDGVQRHEQCQQQQPATFVVAAVEENGGTWRQK